MSLTFGNNKPVLSTPSEIKELIGSELGIDAMVTNHNGSTVIVVETHFSLSALVRKLEKHYSFSVHHKKDTYTYFI